MLRTRSEMTGTSAINEQDAFRRRPFARYQDAVMGLRNYWYPAALARQVPRLKPLPVKLLGEELMLVREAGKIYCLQGRCAHRGVPLWHGNREFACTITCPYHGWTYDLRDGRVVAALTDGPDSSVVGKGKIKSYPGHQRQGVVWVLIGDVEPPPLEEDVYPDFLEEGALLGARVFEWPGNW